MSRISIGWQVLEPNEVLSLMFKAYLLSLVLVISVVVWTASDAWTLYVEYYYMTSLSIRVSNYSNF
uniref:Uncharacterized protein n=1 Tax=Physcomitrium patens TaxID=3218 RepID=A0A2K1JXI5_PHYPA|nr:hypothetical protein PHYPA_013361 [Physcomitrium patens]